MLTKIDNNRFVIENKELIWPVSAVRVVSENGDMHSVLIAGYYGFNNLGDEAILSSILSSLHTSSLGQPVKAIVVSGNPALTRQQHGVEAVAVNDISAIAAAAQTCTAIILGGGGLFHDYFGFESATILTAQHSGLSYPVSIAALASTLHKPLCLYAVGVGPLFSDAGRQYTRAIFQQAALITVRDAASRTELTQLGLPEGTITLTADPAFALTSASDARVVEIFAAEHLNPTAHYLGLSLRDWDVGVRTQDWTIHVAHALDHLIEAHDVSVLYIPFQVEDFAHLDDRQTALTVQRHMRHPDRLHLLTSQLTASEVIGVFQRCRVVLGMRLHALILAAVAATPVVGLIYDPKVGSALQQLGAEGLTLDQLSDASLTALLSSAFAAHDAQSSQLISRVGVLATLAAENVRLFIGLLTAQPATPTASPIALSQLVGDRLVSLLTADQRSSEQLQQRQQQVDQLMVQVSHFAEDKAAWAAERQQLAEHAADERTTLHAERQQLLAQLALNASERMQLLGQLARDVDAHAAQQRQLFDQLTSEADARAAEKQQLNDQFSQERDLWRFERQQLLTQVAYDDRKLKAFLSSRTWRVADGVRRAVFNTPAKSATRFLYRGTRKLYQSVLPYDTRTKLAHWRASAKRKLAPSPAGLTNTLNTSAPSPALLTTTVSQAPVPSAPAISVTADPNPIMPNHQDIFIFSIIEFEARFQRPQQLAVHLARSGYRVFYVSSAKFCPVSERPRYRVKLVAPGVYELILPASYQPKIYETILEPNLQAEFTAAFADLQRDLDVYAASMIVHLPFWTPLAFSLKAYYGWFLQYDCMDEWEDFPLIHPTMLEQEKVLVRDSDLVSVTAQLLYDKWAAQAKRCVLVRNAVNFGLFEALVKPNNRLAELGHPIIGYYGAIAEWLDLDLVVYLARQRPQWNFVLLGDTFVDVTALKEMPNVHLLGRKPHEEMPLYLYHFDVCIIPFKINKVTDAVDPVKFYEYVSAGKPIVASRIIELLTYEDYLYLAATHDEFLTKVETALAENDTPLRRRRVELARSNDWLHRATVIKDSVTALFPKVSIIIVTFGNAEITQGCVESILRNTDYPNYEIILVDNASRDATRIYLQYLSMAHPDRVRIILNADNRGFAAANNQGIRLASGDRIVLLNNDTVVPRGWLWNLMRHLDDPKVGLVGPVTNQVGNEARIAVDYTNLTEMEVFASRYMKAHAGQVNDIKMLAMYCVAARRAVIDEIGLLDEAFGLGLFEDDDYSNRIKVAGYRVVCAQDVFVHHYGQASFKQLIASGTYQAIWDKNQAYYEQKWGKWERHTPRPLDT